VGDGLARCVDAEDAARFLGLVVVRVREAVGVRLSGHAPEATVQP
jgi:hypothetical protein